MVGLLAKQAASASNSFFGLRSPVCNVGEVQNLPDVWLQITHHPLLTPCCHCRRQPRHQRIQCFLNLAASGQSITTTAPDP
ncbi:MAG: hypothetical protein IPM82_12560 [Saprospiraceae bacterium]|nr:hypothetical protein [Saprospiraceae bacterium]